MSDLEQLQKMICAMQLANNRLLVQNDELEESLIMAFIEDPHSLSIAIKHFAHTLCMQGDWDFRVRAGVVERPSDQYGRQSEAFLEQHVPGYAFANHVATEVGIWHPHDNSYVKWSYAPESTIVWSGEMRIGETIMRMPVGTCISIIDKAVRKFKFQAVMIL